MAPSITNIVITNTLDKELIDGAIDLESGTEVRFSREIPPHGTGEAVISAKHSSGSQQTDVTKGKINYRLGFGPDTRSVQLVFDTSINASGGGYPPLGTKVISKPTGAFIAFTVTEGMLRGGEASS